MNAEQDGSGVHDPQSPPLHIAAIQINVDANTDRPHVHCSIAGVATNALIDSGSSITCINENIYDAIPHAQKNKLLPCHLKLSSVSGDPLIILGQTSIPFTIDRKITVSHNTLIVKNINSPCILGIDFQRASKMTTDFGNNKLSFPSGITCATINPGESRSQTLQQIDDADLLTTDLPFLSANHKTIIPPFSSRFVQVSPSFPPSWPIPQLPSLFECHGSEESIMNGAIDLLPGGKTRVLLLNTTAHPKEVNRSDTVAHISPLPHPDAMISLSPPTRNNKTITCEANNTNQNLIASLSKQECNAISTARTPITGKIPGPKHAKSKLQFLRKTLKVSCPPDTQEKYWSLVSEFQDIFSESDDDIGHTTTIQHDIQLNTQNPIHIKQFRIPFSQRQFIEAKVNRLVNQGVLEESTSPYNTPIFAIPKKPVPGQPQSFRLIQDLRAINERTLLDKYNLADIKDCIDRVGERQAQVFSSLDLTSGFFQISIKPEARKFTAFTVPGMGKYQWVRVCLGLHGAPSTFAKLMSLVMHGLHQAMVYLDDVLVASRTHTDHIKELKECFVRLRAHNLKLNPFKTELGAQSVQYLGHTITPNGISPSDLKLKALKEFPTPTSKQAVRQFIGLANFYRQLIPNFHRYAGCLTSLIRQSSPYKSGPLPKQAEAAFLALRQKLCSKPIVAFPDPNLPFILCTDAATGSEDVQGGLGAALLQNQNGKIRTIAYASRTLNEAEKNYPPFLLEMAAITWSIEHFSVYLANTRFTVFTDHKPIPKLSRTHKKTFHRLHQLMNQYNFEVVYQTGESNTVADALSRNPLTSPAPPDSCPGIAAITLGTRANLAHLQSQDEFCTQMAQFIASPSVPPPNDSPWKLIIAKNAPYCSSTNNILQILTTTPNDPTGATPKAIIPRILVPHVIKAAHCSRFAGHLGTKKTIARIMQHYWWPSMIRDVTDFITVCQTCQTINNPYAHRSRLAPVHPIAAPDKPNQRVHADLYGPIRKSNKGNTWILVVTDAFTKFTKISALPNKNALTVSDAIFKTWISNFGPMTTLITDNGKEFANQLNKELCKLLNIKKKFTSSMHPQANAAAESFNKWIIHYMKATNLENEEDWDDLLAPLMMAYNTAVHDSSNMSPHFLTFGMNPNSPLFPAELNPQQHEVNTPWAAQLQTNLEKAYKTVHRNIEQTRTAMERAQKHTRIRTFQPNDRVLIFYPKSSFTGKGIIAKWAKNWCPGTIISKVNSLDYVVRKDNTTNTFVCHVNRLKPLLTDSPPQHHSPPPQRSPPTRRSTRSRRRPSSTPSAPTPGSAHSYIPPAAPPQPQHSPIPPSTPSPPSPINPPPSDWELNVQQNDSWQLNIMDSSIFLPGNAQDQISDSSQATMIHPSSLDHLRTRLHALAHSTPRQSPPSSPGLAPMQQDEPPTPVPSPMDTQSSQPTPARQRRPTPRPSRLPSPTLSNRRPSPMDTISEPSFDLPSLQPTTPPIPPRTDIIRPQDLPPQYYIFHPDDVTQNMEWQPINPYQLAVASNRQRAQAALPAPPQPNPFRTIPTATTQLAIQALDDIINAPQILSQEQPIPLPPPPDAPIAIRAAHDILLPPPPRPATRSQRTQHLLLQLPPPEPNPHARLAIQLLPPSPQPPNHQATSDSPQPATSHSTQTRPARSSFKPSAGVRAALKCKRKALFQLSAPGTLTRAARARITQQTQALYDTFIDLTRAHPPLRPRPLDSADTSMASIDTARPPHDRRRTRSQSPPRSPSELQHSPTFHGFSPSAAAKQRTSLLQTCSSLLDLSTSSWSEPEGHTTNLGPYPAKRHRASKKKNPKARAGEQQD